MNILSIEILGATKLNFERSLLNHTSSGSGDRRGSIDIGLTKITNFDKF